MKNCTRQVVLDYVNTDHLFNITHIIFKKTNSVAPPQTQNAQLKWRIKCQRVVFLQLICSNLLCYTLTLSETTAEPDSKRSRWCSSICKCVAVDIFQPCLWRQNQVYEPNHVYLNLTWASTQRCQETETECKESSIIKKCEADPRLSAHMNENNYTSQRASRRPHVISVMTVQC